ncbi:MAG: hypothetical protein AAF558_11115 [Verrucomicrobiota bacterium]
MRLMLFLSLGLNLIVLIPVCAGLLTEAAWAQQAYGEKTHARQILLSIYLAIGIVSAGLLVLQEPKMVAALLLVQVVYKLSTPITVGTFSHSVVVSNILISVFHIATLVSIFRHFQMSDIK